MNRGWKGPALEGWRGVVDAALREDIGPGDLTAGIFEPDQTFHYVIEAQGPGIVCGLGLASWIFNCEPKVNDGDRVSDGTYLMEGRFNAADLLSRERTALNLLMMMSGVATLTSQFVEAVAGTSAVITDTRKTIPGLRAFQKYAVRCGGGQNHRIGLFDAAMIKDNHIRCAGSIGRAVAKLRLNVGHMVKIEVECETLSQVEEALLAGADVIMLDNFEIEAMKSAVELIRGRAISEASGGVNLQTVREIAETGVDVISVGALTHSAPSLPIHLEVLD